MALKLGESPLPPISRWERGAGGHFGLNQARESLVCDEFSHKLTSHPQCLLILLIKRLSHGKVFWLVEAQMILCSNLPE